jgi:hypothetical protein
VSPLSTDLCQLCSPDLRVPAIHTYREPPRRGVPPRRPWHLCERHYRPLAARARKLAAAPAEVAA